MIDNLLGTNRSALKDLQVPYTSDLIPNRVLNDVFRQEEAQILSITKLVFFYLDLTKAEAVSMFSKTKLKLDSINVGDRLALQVVSWTTLNRRKILASL